MALTATASNTLLSHVIRDTGMIDPVIIQVSPVKDNLCYGALEVSSIDDFMPLVQLLKKERLSFNRTIIYCKKLLDCGQLFQLFKSVLNEELSEPIGAPFLLPQYRMVDCYTKCTEDEIKDVILRNCKEPNSVLRVIIATAAFGMGVDCMGVTRVIHWGPPSDVETYIQQTGRSGRSGEQSYCLMLHGKRLMKYTSKEMVAYCHNNSLCRRDTLFKDFSMYLLHGQKCGCCDICACNCNCSKCSTLNKMFSLA